MKTGLITSDTYQNHDTGPGHPEQIARVTVINENFKRLNIEYKKKFNFPFIIAVKGKNKNQILDYFRERIKNSPNEEFLEAKKQVKKIASFRLEEIIK